MSGEISALWLTSISSSTTESYTWKGWRMNGVDIVLKDSGPGQDSYINQGATVAELERSFQTWDILCNGYIALRRPGRTRKLCVCERGIEELVFTDIKDYNKKRASYTIGHRMDIWPVWHFTQTLNMTEIKTLPIQILSSYNIDCSHSLILSVSSFPFLNPFINFSMFGRELCRFV